jgi:hypothetical protein
MVWRAAPQVRPHQVLDLGLCARADLEQVPLLYEFAAKISFRVDFPVDSVHGRRVVPAQLELRYGAVGRPRPPDKQAGRRPCLD